MTTTPHSRTASVPDLDNLYLELYLTGASVGRNSVDILVQKSSEVESILDRRNISRSSFVSDSDDKPPLYRVEIASDSLPARFASTAEAERAIAAHLRTIQESGEDGKRGPFKIVPDLLSPSMFFDVPLVLDNTSALTVSLAEKLSNDRSPPNVPVGSTNIVREMTNAEPDVDPSRLTSLIDALHEQPLDPDIKGAAIISVATIILDGGTDKLNAALDSLSSDRVRSLSIRTKAAQLLDVVDHISETITPDGMIYAIRKTPEAALAPAPIQAPGHGSPSPSP